MVNAAREHEAPEPAEAAEPARPYAPPPAPASAAQVLQRGAGNAAVARMLQRASAPEPGGGLTRDPSQLEILPKPPAGAKLDYLDYTRSEDGVEDSKKIWRWSFRSATWDLTASWILDDSSGFVVSHSTGLAAFPMEPPSGRTSPRRAKRYSPRRMRSDCRRRLVQRDARRCFELAMRALGSQSSVAIAGRRALACSP